MAAATSPVYAIADRYIDELAALDPLEATDMGVAGYDDTLTDLSPDGYATRDALWAPPAPRLDAAPVQSDRDEIARAFMLERLGIARERYAAGDHLRDVRVLGTAMGATRSTFDLMAFDDDAQWATAARRMRAVPEALARWCES